MTVIFKGDDIVLENEAHVQFDRFIYEGTRKVGWFDTDGYKHIMSDMCYPWVESVLVKIQHRIRPLHEDEIESIKQLLDYHACEMSAAAERVSDLLEVNYYEIYNLL